MKKRTVIDDKINSPNWTEKQLRDLKVMFSVRMHDYYCGTKSFLDCTIEADEIVNNVPTELLINIEEWSRNLPLSNIKVHGVYVNDVFDNYGRVSPIHFVDILRCMIVWKETDYFTGSNIFANRFCYE